MSIILQQEKNVYSKQINFD